MFSSVLPAGHESNRTKGYTVFPFRANTYRRLTMEHSWSSVNPTDIDFGLIYGSPVQWCPEW